MIMEFVLNKFVKISQLSVNYCKEYFYQIGKNWIKIGNM